VTRGGATSPPVFFMTKRIGRIQFLSPGEREEFASLGGKAVQNMKRGHQWTAEEARAASVKRWYSALSRDRQARILKQLAGE
jgi:hypothetical protein